MGLVKPIISTDLYWPGLWSIVSTRLKEKAAVVSIVLPVCVVWVTGKSSPSIMLLLTSLALLMQATPLTVDQHPPDVGLQGLLH